MDKIDNITFEQALAELETIVRLLEEGKVSLEEAIHAYERGTALRRYCEDKLNQAKLRIDKISVDEAGQSRLETFDLPSSRDA